VFVCSDPEIVIFNQLNNNNNNNIIIIMTKALILIVVVVVVILSTTCNNFFSSAFQIASNNAINKIGGTSTATEIIGSSSSRRRRSNTNNKFSSLRLKMTTTTSDNDNDDQSSSSSSKSMDDIAAAAVKKAQQEADYPPLMLEPFLEAADPMYMVRGPVGEGGGDSAFVVSREGEPTKDELTNENLYQIVVRKSNVTDLEVNTLVWKCLGYRFNKNDEIWTPTKVFPKWKERYPTPPDLIGMQHIYTKEIDRDNLKNNQRLTVSVPMENKQSLKTFLRPIGFTGYKISELTPNLTRRAQCTNWLLYYREELFGYTLDELIEKRKLKKEKEEEEQQQQNNINSQDASSVDKNWKPPVKEVF
jgi:hypothetical protein